VLKPPRLYPSASRASAASPFFAPLGRGAARPGGVLVGPDDATVHRAVRPDQGLVLVRLPLQGLEDRFPEPPPLPADQAIIAGFPGAIPLGDLPPGGAGALPPADAIDHRPVLLVRMPAVAFLRGQQRFQARPFVVAQVSACHSGRILPIQPRIYQTLPKQVGRVSFQK
jgi:hypothetical protein